MQNKLSSPFDQLKNLDLHTKGDPRDDATAARLKEKDRKKQEGQEGGKRYGVIHVSTGEDLKISEHRERPIITDILAPHPKGFVRVGSSYVPQGQINEPYQRPKEETPHDTQRRKEVEGFATDFTNNRIKEWKGAIEATAKQEAEEEKRALLEQFNAFLTEVKMLEEVGKRNKTAEEKIATWERLSMELGLEIESIRMLTTVPDTHAEIESQKKEAKRTETIKKIGELLKNGIDQVVIHGSTVEGKDGKPVVAWNVDLDTAGALYLLNSSRVEYKPTAQTELVGKGNSTENKDTGERKIIVHVDTGGRELSTKVDAFSNDLIYLDHHYMEYREEQVSGTSLMYQILEKNQLMETQPWMKDFVQFVTSIDNLSYIKPEDCTPEFIQKKWANSLFAIGKNLPIEFIVQFFKDGRDPWTPKFTAAEKKLTVQNNELLTENGGQAYKKDAQGNDTAPIIQTKDGKNTIVYRKDATGKPIEPIVAYKEISLGELLIKKNGQATYAVGPGYKRSLAYMEKEGIKSDTKEWGRVFFNTIDPQIGPDGKEYINRLPGDLGTLLAWANGYDTYIAFNENKAEPAKSNTYFMNSKTYNLDPAKEILSQIVPETVYVRGIMILGPQSSSERAAMTKEKFLEALHLVE
jgi:hypothetical protein